MVLMGIPAYTLFKKPLLNTRGGESELCSWICFKPLMGQKGGSEDLSFVLVFFHLDPPGYKGENISIFPN